MKQLWLTIVKPKGTSAKWLIFLTLIAIIALGAGGHFEILREYLDTPRLTFSVGDYKMSVYGALRAGLTLALLFWIAAIVSDIIEKRLGKVRRLRAATRTLLTKIIQIALYFVVFLMAMNVVGIDLTALTVFSGALGIGLGFGLQKIASNFISGLILLMEKSVEYGDLIELPDGTVGFVKKSAARYTLIETLDTKEILVPNEDFITNRVTNWTLSNPKGRVQIPVGVSYDSDIEKAQALILEAAREHSACIDEPAPQCFLRNFGDSSVDFVLHFWVGDVTKGRWGPQSEVMFEIWRKFKKNKIEIPFPQRDLHIKTSDVIKVKNNGK